MGNSGFWYLILIIVVAGWLGHRYEKWRKQTVKMTVDELRPEIQATQTMIEETQRVDERMLVEIHKTVQVAVREEMRAVLDEWTRNLTSSQPKRPWDT